MVQNKRKSNQEAVDADKDAGHYGNVSYLFVCCLVLFCSVLLDQGFLYGYICIFIDGVIDGDLLNS